MDEEIRKELKDKAPRLSRLQGEEEGFRVPPGYFEGLQQEVMARVRAEDKPEKLKVRKPGGGLRMIRGDRRWWAAAAAVLLLVAAGWWALEVRQSTSEPAFALEELSTEEAAAFLEANLEEYELAMLVEGLDAEKADLQEPPALDPELEEYLNELELEDLEEFF